MNMEGKRCYGGRRPGEEHCCYPPTGMIKGAIGLVEEKTVAGKAMRAVVAQGWREATRNLCGI